MSAVTNEWKQKRGKLRTSFTFGKAGLDYSFAAKSGDLRKQHFRWEALPHPREYTRVIDRDDGIPFVMFFMCGMTAFQLFRHQDFALPAYGLCSVFFVVLLIGASLLRPIWRVETTLIPPDEAPILVLKDKQHDAILAALEAQRIAALRPFCTIQPQQTVRGNLLRFHALVMDGVMTPDEFFARQKEMVPEITHSLLRAEPTGDTVRLHQRSADMRIDYEFTPQRVQYARHSWLMGSRSFALDYRYLPPPTAVSEISEGHFLVSAVLGWMGVGLLAYYMSLIAGQPVGYYVGGAGLERLLHDLQPFGIVVLPYLVLCFSLRRVFRRRYSIPLAHFLVLHGAQRDAVITLLQERRIALYRWYAQPSALVSEAEHASYLDWLEREDLLTQDEIGALLQEGKRLHKHYAPLLDAPIGSGSATTPAPLVLH